MLETRPSWWAAPTSRHVEVSSPESLLSHSDRWLQPCERSLARTQPRLLTPRLRVNFLVLSPWLCYIPVQFSSVQLLSRVQLFVTPWTTTCQASLSITNSRSPPKPKSTESVMPSNPLILCHPLSSCPQSFPVSGSSQMSQIFASSGQCIGVSASTSVLPMNTQDSSPLGWTGWISLQSKGLSRVISNTTVQKHQFFGTQLSL